MERKEKIVSSPLREIKVGITANALFGKCVVDAVGQFLKEKLKDR